MAMVIAKEETFSQDIVKVMVDKYGMTITFKNGEEKRYYTSSTGYLYEDKKES